MEKKNPLPPDPANDQADHTAPAHCPHWNSAARLCLLVKEGLFLPVPEHIAAFCEGGGQARCPQVRSHADRANRATNRRRSVRLSERHPFRFSEISRTDQPTTQPGDEAWTLDLSDHGIRVATTCQLRPDMAIRFQLEGNGSPGREGTGRVVWCQPLADTAFFEIGVALADQPDPAALPRSRRARRA